MKNKWSLLLTLVLLVNCDESSAQNKNTYGNRGLPRPCPLCRNHPPPHPPTAMNCRRSRRKNQATKLPAVAGPFMTTSRASLRTYSQSVTRLRPMQWGSGITILLSLPLLTTSPMALVLPT